MKTIQWLSLFIVTILLAERVNSGKLFDRSFEVRRREKRQAGLMPVLFLVAAAKAVFGKAYIAGSLIKSRGGVGGGQWGNQPPGE